MFNNLKISMRPGFIFAPARMPAIVVARIAAISIV